MNKSDDVISSFITSLPKVDKVPHFKKIAFKVRKKIFATLDEELQQINLKLTEIEQDVFKLVNTKAIYAVKNKWGKQGWTIFQINELEMSILKEAIINAYCNVAPQKLLEQTGIQKYVDS